MQGKESRNSQPDAAKAVAHQAAAPAAQLASWNTVAHVDWREQVEEQANAGDVASTSQQATAAAESWAVVPAAVTPAVERMLQVMHSYPSRCCPWALYLVVKQMYNRCPAKICPDATLLELCVRPICVQTNIGSKCMLIGYLHCLL